MMAHMCTLKIYINDNFAISGVKLSMKAVPLATAATLYHKFFAVADINKYDPYVSDKLLPRLENCNITVD